MSTTEEKISYLRGEIAEQRTRLDAQEGKAAVAREEFRIAAQERASLNTLLELHQEVDTVLAGRVAELENRLTDAIGANHTLPCPLCGGSRILEFTPGGVGYPDEVVNCPLCYMRHCNRTRLDAQEERAAKERAHVDKCVDLLGRLVNLVEVWIGLNNALAERLKFNKTKEVKRWSSENIQA